MHIYIPSHTDHRHTQSTRMNTRNTYGLVLLPSLPGQVGSPLVRRSVGTCTRWIPPAAGLRHSGFPVVAPVFDCQAMDIQAPEVAALPQLLVRLRHTKLARNPPVPHCPLCSHTQSCPTDLLAPYPQGFHLPTSHSCLALAGDRTLTQSPVPRQGVSGGLQWGFL